MVRVANFGITNKTVNVLTVFTCDCLVSVLQRRDAEFTILSQFDVY